MKFQCPNQPNNVSRTAKFLQAAAILILCLLPTIALLRGSYVTAFSCKSLRFPWTASQQDLENGEEELGYPNHIAEDDSPFSDIPSKDDLPINPIRRYDLEYDQVACWPSTGGVWIKALSPLEMQHLNLDRFADAERSADHVEEDAFCIKLQQLGASWWELPPQWPWPTSWCGSIDACVQPVIKGSVEIAYPENGGVCVLRIPDEWENHGDFLLWNALRKALTMAERCQVILRLGGKRCDDLEECEDLP